ncbi:MAG: pyruvate kinase, partial [Desulfobacula sp.]|nr:pyruvate kinase [Desulfobacula sp.]
MAVRTMANIAKEVEKKRSSFINAPYSSDDKITAYLAKAAVKASLRLNANGIVADSLTGRSIRALAAYRCDSPIYAQIYDKQVVRQLSLSFGVFAEYMPLEITEAASLKPSIIKLLDRKLVKPEDLIIVLAGSFGVKQGASYVEISTALNFKNQCP